MQHFESTPSIVMFSHHTNLIELVIKLLCERRSQPNTSHSVNCCINDRKSYNSLVCSGVKHAQWSTDVACCLEGVLELELQGGRTEDDGDGDRTPAYRKTLRFIIMGNDAVNHQRRPSSSTTCHVVVSLFQSN